MMGCGDVPGDGDHGPVAARARRWQWIITAVLWAGLLWGHPREAAAETSNLQYSAQPANESPAEKVVITTDLVRATFDPVGGTLVRVELLTYPDASAPRGKTVLLDQSPQHVYVAQSGVLAGVSPDGVTHLSPMSVTPGTRDLGDGRNELELRFESAAVAGSALKLVKVFTFRRGEYTIGVKHDVVNLSASPVAPVVYLQLVRDDRAPAGEPRFASTFTGPAMYSEAGKYSKIDFKSIEKAAASGRQERYASANNGWVAMVQHYFVSAWLLGGDADDDAKTKRTREFFTRKVGPNQYAVGMIVPLERLAPGATAVLDSRLFVGPQEERKLSEAGTGLDRVKDYGVFAALSKPLFWLLLELHRIVGNWGWSIVGMVVLLKIAFYWLNSTAYGSMAKMKVINPKIAEMRERLKDQAELQQQETMRIYREEKINPLGGCLPILVQIPFFIALYWVLLASVEMRNAPWQGWITDLSVTDPLFILPVLTTITSLVQTRLNPTPVDPTQAAMMWIMPLVFSAMFFFFPAGLVLYWLTNSVLSIAQQYLVNRRIGLA